MKVKNATACTLWVVFTGGYGPTSGICGYWTCGPIPVAAGGSLYYLDPTALPGSPALSSSDTWDYAIVKDPISACSVYISWSTSCGASSYPTSATMSCGCGATAYAELNAPNDGFEIDIH